MAKLCVAVDAMGSDHAPEVIVDGALAAMRHVEASLAFVGSGPAIRHALARHDDWPRDNVRIVDAPDVVGAHELPAAALRDKPRSSIRLAAGLVASGEASALFSAGSTGATVMAMLEACGRLPGIDRPALAATIPTQRGAAVLLDVGASASCRGRHLQQFGVMGCVFARLTLGISDPRVGLLSIGEEESKGTDVTREAHQRLKASPVRFVGNVEGRDIYSGSADVIVCDGFTGNVVLKTSEGLVDMVEGLLGAELRASAASAAGGLPVRRAFRRFRRRVDHSEYGGAPLLGTAGLALVGHGRSSAKAVRNAVVMAARLASSGLVSKIEQEMIARA